MEGITQFLLAPFEFSFMARAFVAAVLVGALCAVVGTYVVLRGLAFIGDALAHAIFPGVVIAFLLGANFVVGALIAGLLTALGIGFVSRRSGVSEDTSIGILFAGAFALGVALLSTVRSYAVDLAKFLFGNVLGVTELDLLLTAAIALVVLLTLVLFHKELVMNAFDPTAAAAMGLPTGLLSYLLLALLALVIVISLQTVGTVLVLAMVVTPSATAYLLVNRISHMMLLGALLGAVSAVVGLYISFYLNVASGAAIVLVVTALFFSVMFLAPQKGVLARRLAALRAPAAKPQSP